MKRPKKVTITAKRVTLQVRRPKKITITAKPKKREWTPEEKKERRKRRLLTIEVAKSSRSKCKSCRCHILKGEYRVGMITFIPHRNVKWYHLKKPFVSRLTMMLLLEKSIGWDKLPGEQKQLAQECWSRQGLKIPSLYSLAGPLDMPRLATALTTRYDRFRSFRFALPENQRWTSNWNWRCFIATMLVCNTREETMLKITDQLFQAYPDQDSLLALYDKPEEREKWKAYMIKEDLRHAKRKMRQILYATKIIKEQHGGRIPTSREALRKIPGVGSHVSSVTLAWVHQAAEFGIDVHVRRILERWEYIPEKMKERDVESLVKENVNPKKLGHFSRAFVDHGQSICGYVPDCANCYLRKCCPSAGRYLSKELEW